MQLVFATNNPHKIEEIGAMLQGAFIIVSLQAIGCTEELPETQLTIEGNALQKARYVWECYGQPCFAEDTGLEIDALKGEPGVHTAHYAGPQRDADANMNLVLQKLNGIANRQARFKTVIALLLHGEAQLFIGTVEGRIAEAKRGHGGFGYDPIFIPDGYDQTFAELPASVKNQISHRAQATAQLIDFLQSAGR